MQSTRKGSDLNNGRRLYQGMINGATNGYLEETLMISETLKKRRVEGLDLKVIAKDLENSLRGWIWRKSHFKEGDGLGLTIGKRKATLR